MYVNIVLLVIYCNRELTRGDLPVSLSHYEKVN